ncbi:RHS repeat domain-containing protein, partial [Phocaeicola sartorii]
TFSGGVTVRTERDCFGREIRKSVRSGGIEQGAYRYQWGIANRLLSKENELTGTVTRYDYDRFDFLIRQETMQGSETDVIYRVPDFVGNLFETPDKKDRKYGAGGKLLEDPDCFYHYDDEGNLIFREFKQLQETGVKFDRKHMEKERGIRCLATGTGWLYEWSSNGMLKKVIRPDGRPVEFRYDALGRRTAKQYFGKVTRWVWDGNVPIHEWSYKITDMQPDEEESTPLKEPTKDITTWVFEAGTFVPTAKIQEGKQYSIVSDYMGTPIQMYDEQGNKIWDCTLDIYGKVFTVNKGTEFDCPFRYTGQYFDSETDLYYNRFRYYSPEIGNYISQDPIGLNGSNPTLYGYVKDVNLWIDIFGFEIIPNKAAGLERETIAKAWLQDKYPNAEILSERYLRDVDGKSVKDIDVVGGSRRRVDFVVVENGKVVGVYEVTSPTAKKTDQIEKERIIRNKAKGGAHIKAPGRKGKLYNISDIETVRLDVDLETKKVKHH